MLEVSNNKSILSILITSIVFVGLIIVMAYLIYKNNKKETNQEKIVTEIIIKQVPTQTPPQQHISGN